MQHERDESRDLSRLAAAYGYGIAKNHPFIDGNKRTALVVSETFLNLNGLGLMTDDATFVAVMQAVADGTMKEEQFACWDQRKHRASQAAAETTIRAGCGTVAIPTLIAAVNQQCADLRFPHETQRIYFQALSWRGIPVQKHSVIDGRTGVKS